MDMRYAIQVVCPSCGEMRWATRYNVKAMKTMRCKPCSARANGHTQATHGLEKHPLYKTWTNMTYRVDQTYDNPKNRRYVGLDMDPEWRDVRLFVAWAIGAGWQPGLSIERIDNQRGYWPDNCRFIPVKHQARNRRDNSVTLTLAREIQARVAAGEIRNRVAHEYAKKTGIPISTLLKVAYGYNWK